MKRRTLRAFAAAALVAALLVSGCDQAGLTPDAGIAVEGTWALASSYSADYDETWVIDDSTISYTSGTTLQWTGTVISYDNDAFNASETGEGDYGYAVIYYTYALNSGWGEAGKYNIFRWQNYDTDSCDFTVGYKDDGAGSYANDVAASAADAISDITYADGYFGGWSSGASLQ